MRPTVTAVIPTLNEARNLPEVLQRLPRGVNELIIVDGHSTDDTVQVALSLRPDARIVFQDGRGKGNALACGFAAARGDIVVMIDADGSTDPAEIPDYIRPLIQGADFVKGSRYMHGGGSDDITWLRSVGNRALGLSVNLAFGTRYTDLCYGYSAFWRRVLPQLQISCDGFEVETLMNVRAAKAGLRIVEVPSYERARIYGLSNLNAWRDGRRVLSTIVGERLSGLPGASDAWMPDYTELGESVPDLRIVTGRRPHDNDHAQLAARSDTHRVTAGARAPGRSARRAHGRRATSEEPSEVKLSVSFS
ncbi:MAG: glycosyltransferase family 2 protein [Solirubrobacteraceae bacterium]